jgi:predicted nuclease of predicted toxin-antitoxin system
MRLLLDESVPAGLRRYLPGYTVLTVVEKGWSGMKNGTLLAQAALEFDALITVDKNMPHQQNLAQLPLAVVILDTSSNELAFLMPLIPALLQILPNLTPRAITILK